MLKAWAGARFFRFAKGVRELIEIYNPFTNNFEDWLAGPDNFTGLLVNIDIRVKNLKSLSKFYGQRIYRGERLPLNPIAEGTRYFGNGNPQSFSDCMVNAPNAIGRSILVMHGPNFSGLNFEEYFYYLRILKHATNTLKEYEHKFTFGFPRSQIYIEVNGEVVTTFSLEE